MFVSTLNQSLASQGVENSCLMPTGRLSDQSEAGARPIPGPLTYAAQRTLGVVLKNFGNPIVARRFRNDVLL